MKFENLPPLNSLRYFEAAARCGSFTLAAGELNVTQGAISQQVRNLEGFLGAPLFVRGATTISLTETGREYFSTIRSMLQKVDAATSKVKNGRGSDRVQEICLSASPSFVNAWLIKRMSKFHRDIKGIRLSLNATTHYVDFEAENVDMAIRHGDGQWPGLHSELLIKDSIVAVCNPRLLGKRRPPTRLVELAGYPLIEDKIHRYWARYARSIAEKIDLTSALLFDDSGVIVEAAVNAQGIALARAFIAERAIMEGQLVKLFDANFTGNIGYHIVYPESRISHKGVLRVSNWLKREALAI
jgi:LysR family glycine cleavage system transcriptional activator